METISQQWQLGRAISRLAVLAVLMFPRRSLPISGSNDANTVQFVTWTSLFFLSDFFSVDDIFLFFSNLASPFPWYTRFIDHDIVGIICLLVGVLLSVAFFTLVERKVMASSQRRKGPDLVGFWGVLQPIADGLKLVVKENVVPQRANSFLFFVAALLPFVMAFTSWVFLPLSPAPLADISAGLPMLLAFSSIGVYGIIFSGWASNSKYAFLGGLRSAAQVISYELVLGFCYLCVILLSHSMDLTSIVYAQRQI